MSDNELSLLVSLVVEHILRRGVRPEFSVETIAGDIRRILQLRWKGVHVNDIPYHSHPVVCPLEWTEYNEWVWRDWLEARFTYEDWEDEVLYPMFGTESAPWEYSVPGWREELHQFLWTWIRRSRQIVEEADPMPEIEEEVEEHVRLNIDPYILEHGSAKQKRAAFKSRHSDTE